MTNISHEVRNFLLRNPHIIKSLNEGIINIRGLSVYIIKRTKIAASVDAVMSNIRRFQEELGHSKEGKERITDVMKDSRISTKSRLVMIEVERHFRALKNIIPPVLDSIRVSKGDVLRIIEGRRSFFFVCDHSKKDEIIQLIPKTELIRIREKLAELNIHFSEKYGDAPGILSPILDELAMHNINIIEMVGGMPETIIFVADEDISRAHDAVLNLLYNK